MKLPSYRATPVQALPSADGAISAIKAKAEGSAAIGRQFSDIMERLTTEFQDRRDAYEIQEGNKRMSDAENEIAGYQSRDYISVEDLDERGISTAGYTPKTIIDPETGEEYQGVENFRVFPQLQRSVLEKAEQEATSRITHSVLRDKFSNQVKIQIEDSDSRALVAARDQAEALQIKSAKDNIVRETAQGNYDNARSLVGELPPEERETIEHVINKTEVDDSIKLADNGDLEDADRINLYSKAVSIIKEGGKEVLGDKYEEVLQSTLEKQSALATWSYAQAEYFAGRMTKEELKDQARKESNDMHSRNLMSAANRLPTPLKGEAGVNSIITKFNDRILKLKQATSQLAGATPEFSEQIEREAEALRADIWLEATRAGVPLDKATQTLIDDTVNMAKTSGQARETPQYLQNKWVQTEAMDDTTFLSFYHNNVMDMAAMSPADKRALSMRVQDATAAKREGNASLFEAWSTQYTPEVLASWDIIPADGDDQEGKLSYDMESRRLNNLFLSYGIANSTPDAAPLERNMLMDNFKRALTSTKYKKTGWTGWGVSKYTFNELADDFDDDTTKKDVFYQSLTMQISSGVPIQQAISDAYINAKGYTPSEHMLYAPGKKEVLDSDKAYKGFQGTLDDMTKSQTL